MGFLSGLRNDVLAHRLRQDQPCHADYVIVYLGEEGQVG